MIAAPIPLESSELEPYRALRAALAYRRLPEGKRVVLFTSARQGEGKSTTAANFAAACAYAEQRTLLVDADLRRPRLHEVFDLDGTYGLSNALERDDADSLTALSQATGIEWLDIVVGGHAALGAAELLGRGAFADFIADARATYDWVVLDAPPVLPIADAAIVSRVVDGVVLVVDMRHTPLESARRARDLLRAVGAPLLGVVANNTLRSTATYGYGAYPR